MLPLFAKGYPVIACLKWPQVHSQCAEPHPQVLLPKPFPQALRMSKQTFRSSSSSAARSEQSKCGAFRPTRDRSTLLTELAVDSTRVTTSFYILGSAKLERTLSLSKSINRNRCRNQDRCLYCRRLPAMSLEGSALHVRWRSALHTGCLFDSHLVVGAGNHPGVARRARGHGPPSWWISRRLVCCRTRSLPRAVESLAGGSR